jgi:hypothetical protein
MNASPQHLDTVNMDAVQFTPVDLKWLHMYTNSRQSACSINCGAMQAAGSAFCRFPFHTDAPCTVRVPQFCLPHDMSCQCSYA